MNARQNLLHELEQVPEPILNELVDFARFLREKAGQGKTSYGFPSEPVMPAEYMDPEEDPAWHDR